MYPECPNCRESVSFLRSIRTTAWGSFRCKTCGSVLGISFGRRMIAAGIWLALLLFTMEILKLHLMARVWTYSMMLATFFMLLYLCEKVTLLDRRAFTCKQCGYDLHGLQEKRCPECNLEFDPDERERILARISAPPPRRKYRWVAPLVVVILALGVAAGMLVYRNASRVAAGGAAAVPTSMPSSTTPQGNY